MIHTNVYDKAQRLIKKNKVKIWCGHPVWLKDDFNELESHYYENKDKLFTADNFIDTNRFFFHMRRGELLRFIDKIDEKLTAANINLDDEINPDFIDLLIVYAIAQCMKFLFDSPKRYDLEEFKVLNDRAKGFIKKAVELGYSDDFILSFTTDLFDS